MRVKEIDQVYESSAEREVRGMAGVGWVGWGLDEGTCRASYRIARNTQNVNQQKITTNVCTMYRIR